MKKFEYMRISGYSIMPKETILISELNKYGSQGWELVEFTWVRGRLAFAYFKREVQQ